MRRLAAGVLIGAGPSTTWIALSVLAQRDWRRCLGLPPESAAGTGPHVAAMLLSPASLAGAVLFVALAVIWAQHPTRLAPLLVAGLTAMMLLLLLPLAAQHDCDRKGVASDNLMLLIAPLGYLAILVALLDPPAPEHTAMTDRLPAQFAFLTEADRLKSVLRANTLADRSRPENSAEHSWHLALYAMVLADQADPEVRIDRVIRMLILHDLVEIDVGDVPIHSANGTAHASAEIQAAEARAADRIFGLLPADLGHQFRALWQEFEAAETPDAIFAKSLDRAQPVMQNSASGGGTWVTYNVSYEQLETRVGQKIARGAPRLWDWLKIRARDFLG